jgi:hypothetical protein
MNDRSRLGCLGVISVHSLFRVLLDAPHNVTPSRTMRSRKASMVRDLLRRSFA